MQRIYYNSDIDWEKLSFLKKKNLIKVYKAFYGWLHQPNEAPENQKPMVLLESTMGINQLMTELGRIEHGIFA